MQIVQGRFIIEQREERDMPVLPEVPSETERRGEGEERRERRMERATRSLEVPVGLRDSSLRWIEALSFFERVGRYFMGVLPIDLV